MTYNDMRDALIGYVDDKNDKDTAFCHVLLAVEMAALDRQHREPATTDAWIKWRNRAETVAELRHKMFSNF